jgi:exonuclease III
MPTFLFWNVAGKSIHDLIVSLTLSNQADLVVLAECTLDSNDLIRDLNRNSSEYQYAPGFCESLLFFTKFDPRYLTLMAETTRVSIRHLRLPARKELLVVGAHLPSKMHFSDYSQIFQCTELARMIEEQEAKAGHQRTILLGDLNVNPFEAGMVASGGLHAVSTRDVASKGSRVVQGKRQTFFYNPMWRYFGDRNDSASGTYYFEKAESVNYFWNTFDQILIRPDILDGFRTDGVRVITQIGETSLVDHRGRPDTNNASDHLPVLLDIHF